MFNSKEIIFYVILNCRIKTITIDCERFIYYIVKSLCDRFKIPLIDHKIFYYYWYEEDHLAIKDHIFNICNDAALTYNFVTSFEEISISNKRKFHFYIEDILDNDKLQLNMVMLGEIFYYMIAPEVIPSDVEYIMIENNKFVESGRKRNLNFEII